MPKSFSQSLSSILSLLRYRFFVPAGLLIYLVGSAVGLSYPGPRRTDLFLLGLLGIGCSLAAVEAFNEYFDSQSGNDRVFSVSQAKPVGRRLLWTGLLALVSAAGVGLLLSFLRGAWIMAFAACGAIGIIGYVGPPLRLAYRGLGETVIAVCYGPLMVLGTVYLLTGMFRGSTVLVCLPISFLILALAVVNEIPDYYQDKLVGKNNLVVRLGRARAARFYGCLLGLFYISLAVTVALRAIPIICLLLFVTLPFAYRLYVKAVRNADTPKAFIPVIRGMILLFATTAAIMALAFILGSRTN